MISKFQRCKMLILLEFATIIRTKIVKSAHLALPCARARGQTAMKICFACMAWNWEYMLKFSGLYL